MLKRLFSNSQTGSVRHGFRILVAFTLLTGFVLLACPDSIQGASWSTPRLNLILPRGVQQGGEFTLQFTGERLQSAEEIFLYDSGITVLGIELVDEKNIRVKIQVADDCRLGEHLAQIRTRDGVSDFRSFFVGALPQVDEVEPNSSLEQAQSTQQDVTIHGAVTNEDIDYYRITGKQGQRLSVEIEAIRLGFMFDPAIALLDQNRFEIAMADDTPLTKQDAFYSVRLPADGEYYVTVRESSFRGNANCRYRLHIGSFPRPTAVFPMGGKPAESVDLKWFDPSLSSDDSAQFVVQKRVLPTLPDFHSADSISNLFFTDDFGTSPSPIPFRISALENAFETEPNNQLAEAQAVAIPGAINGVIESAGDIDCYKFSSKKGQGWHIRCLARKLGSGLDPVINVFNSSKKRLTGNDDSKKLDAYLFFNTPEDGEYFLKVRDHLRHGQADFVYRIEIAPRIPSLRLGIKRNDRYSQLRQTIAVPQGSRFAVLVEAVRQDCGGEVELINDGIPEGIQMDSLPMKSNLNLMPVVFEATKDAAIAGELIDLRGRVIDPKRDIVGRFQNRADFALGEPNNSLYYAATVDRLAIAVVEPLPFRIDVTAPKIRLVRNGKIWIKVNVDRDEGFEQPIQLQFPFRPPGLGTTNQITIPADKSEALYPVNANKNAQLGKWPFYVLGTANVNGPAWTSSQLAELEIAEPYVNVTFERVGCTQSETVHVVGVVKHLGPFPGVAMAELVGLPPHVTSNGAVELTAQSTEIAFDLQTNENSPVGKHGSLFCRIKFSRDGETVETRAGNVVLHINKPVVDQPVTTTPAGN